MKKLKAKLTRNRPAEKKPSRITNETVAEHREQILAGGRRFKYPVQYTRHRLVINAIILGLVAFGLFLVLCWWQLYKVQTTSDFFYRLTRIVPVPVAVVDGQRVAYGDYLLHYKPSETYINTIEKANENTYEDGGDSQSQYDFYKAKAMSNAVTDTYAEKLAKERDISITDKQVEEAIRLQRQITSSQGEVSQEVFNRSTEQMLGLSSADIRYMTRQSLLRQAVAYDIDATARDTAEVIAAAIKKDSDRSLEKLAQTAKETNPAVQMFVSGWVKKSNPDGGVTAAASKLEEGGVSGPIKPLQGDGYYFVRLIGTNKDGEVNYETLKVPLSMFEKRLEKLRSQDKVTYYIDVPEATPQVKQ